MGEMSEYYGSEETLTWPQQKPDLSVWKTDDGRVLKLVEMVDSHLANTIRFLEAKQVSDVLLDVPKGSEIIIRERQTIRAERLVAFRAEAARRGLTV